MDSARLLTALLLPALLGAAWVRVLWGRVGRPANNGVPLSLVLGYGFPLGVLAVTGLMWGGDVAGLPQGFGWTAWLLVGLTLPALWLGRGLRWRGREAEATAERSGWEAALFWGLLGLVALRFAGFALEILERPLFPWDAWKCYGAHARVWFEFRDLVPFVRWSEWIAADEALRFKSACSSRATIPLVQVWMALAWGRWEDTVINLPWLLAGLSLGAALYGQARLAAVPRWGAMVLVYLVLSLPMLGTHVALAGYLDLWVAAAYALAAAAFFHWVQHRDPRQAVLALLFALACAYIKVPGVLWTLTFLPALIVAVWPTAGLALVVTAVAAIVAAVALLPGGIDWQVPGLGPLVLQLDGPSRLPILGEFTMRYRPIGDAMVKNWFVLDNWHLLWYGVAALLLANIHRMLSRPLRAATVLVVAALASTLAVYSLTERAAWAEDFTQLNRTVLHTAPMVLFYCLWLVRGRVPRPSHRGE